MPTLVPEIVPKLVPDFMLSVGFVSHFLASFILFGLSALLSSQALRSGAQNKRILQHPLLILSLATGLWALATSFTFIETNPIFHRVSQLSEVLRNLAWSYTVISQIKSLADNHQPPFQHWITLCLSVVSIQIIVSLSQLFFPNHFSYATAVLMAAFLTLSVIMLVLVEQLLRNCGQSERWLIKYLCLSALLFYGFDCLLYSQAILWNQLQSNWWEIRGAVILLSMPLLFAQTLRQQYSPSIASIPHKVAFRSSLLLICSLYLVLMAVAGYYFKLFGGGWGDFLQILFIAASLMALLVVLLSGKARATLSHFLNRNFFPFQYDYREQWLKVTSSLSQVTEPAVLAERIIKVLSDSVESTGGVLWIKNENGNLELLKQFNFQVDKLHLSEDLKPLLEFWHKNNAIINLRDNISDNPEHEISDTFFYATYLKQKKEFTQKHHSLAVTGNSTEDTEQQQLPHLPAWLKTSDKAWLLIPLKVHHHIIGLVLLASPRVEAELNWENYAYLKTVASQAASYLYLTIASGQLSRAQRFDAVHQMSAFFVHDFKTMTNQLSMLSKNADKHKNNPIFIDDMLGTVAHTVTKMQRILQHLQKPDSLPKFKTINLAGLLEDLAKNNKHRQPEPVFINHCSKEVDESTLINCDPVSLKTALLHILVNAQDACNDTDSVQIILTSHHHANNKKSSHYSVQIRDTGKGMTPDFTQNELFKPFHSTKGLTGMGLGVYQAKTLIQANKGDIFVESELGVGSIFTVLLPRYSRPDE